MIHDSVVIQPTGRRSPEAAAVRAELGMTDNDLFILQVVHPDQPQDHATALRTLEHVVWHRRNARLVLVGEVFESEQLASAIEERRLTSQVQLLGQRTDVLRLMQAADLFLATSISAGGPSLLLEAMGAGLPVVATQVSSVAEHVEDGLTGLLAPAGDDAALADCILRLARNPQLARQMGHLGRERAARLDKSRG